jgi:hypothetical protein
MLAIICHYNYVQFGRVGGELSDPLLRLLTVAERAPEAQVEKPG